MSRKIFGGQNGRRKVHGIPLLIHGKEGQEEVSEWINKQL